MSQPAFFTDRGHILLAGITGSKDDCGGKTALANWWASTAGRASFDLVIFFNAKGTSTVRGERVEDVGEAGAAIRDGARHLNYVPRSHDWEDEHDRLRRFVAALPEDWTKMVVHDEAPEYDGDDGSLAWFVRVAGNGATTKSIVIAQAPGDLDTAIRRQCPTAIWIGPTSTQNKHWFRANDYGAHFEDIQANQAPYEWTVMQGPRSGDRTRYEPVPEAFA